MSGRVRLYLVGAVVLALGACVHTEGNNVALHDQSATSSPRLSGIATPPVEVRDLDSYAAVEHDATGGIAPAAPMPQIPAPFRKVHKHVFLLLGGLHGHDGWVTSAGMFGLRGQVASLPDVTVTTYGWPSYKQVAADIAQLPKDDVVIVIGYSGGGAKATWLANMPSKPHIDLMIMYDPSPSWGMMPIGPNIKRAICYCNITPAFFGLGGGMLRGRDNTNVEIVKIYEQHMLVQVNQTLHARTIDEVRKVTKVSDPVDPPHAAGSQIPPG